MDEGLSIGMNTAREPAVTSTARSDADVLDNMKHLSVDPENVDKFRKQLESKSQSKEARNASTAENATRGSSEGPASKLSVPNERKFFENNGKYTPPFVSEASLHPSENQNTDGFGKDFREISLKSGMLSQNSALKGTDASTDRIDETYGRQSPFPETPDPSEVSVNHTKRFREIFADTDMIPTDMSLRNASAGNKKYFPENISQSNPDLPQPSLRHATPFAAKSLKTEQKNAFELSKADHAASKLHPLSALETREHSRSSENISEPHRTAVIDTIPFLRTPNETVASIREPIAAQASKSHVMLIAQQIRDHIIDRILVSSSAANAERTVTVQLSPRLLQNTEVQFTQNGTSLDIRLVSQNKDSIQFLQQHQSDLQAYLQGELKTFRAISVRVPSAQSSSELSQPHDGRSRNRFEYQTANEEETT